MKTTLCFWQKAAATTQTPPEALVQIKIKPDERDEMILQFKARNPKEHRQLEEFRRWLGKTQRLIIPLSETKDPSVFELSLY